MAESGIVVAARKAVVDLVSRSIDCASSELFVYIPVDSRDYLARTIAMSFWERVPRDLDKYVCRLLRNLSEDRLKRYDVLRRVGDLIVCFHEFLGLESFISSTGIAQCCYDDASRIGKRIQEREAPVLESIAENFEEYSPVLRRMNGRLVA
ncbi:MAG: hypothetical protein QXT19_04335 [Candidatus Woesearchaeota archaeon]